MTAKLTDQLATVERDIATARAEVERHRKDWRTACEHGMHGHAEELEGAIIATDRRLLRLDVQRTALQEQLNEKEST